MRRVYVAGKYSDDSGMSMLRNMARGIRVSTLVLLNGMAPFCPWLDFLLVIVAEILGKKLALERMYEYSMEWLSVSDAVLVVSQNWEDSQGTKRELERAVELNIPVFFLLGDMITYFERKTLSVKGGADERV